MSHLRTHQQQQGTMASPTRKNTSETPEMLNEALCMSPILRGPDGDELGVVTIPPGQRLIKIG
jgi:hypothetical protein